MLWGYLFACEMHFPGRKTDLSSLDREFDVTICGTAVLDVVVQPIDLDRPIGGDRLFHTAPLTVHPGGIVSNTGAAMSRYGMQVAAMTLVGKDDFGGLLVDRLKDLGIDTNAVQRREEATSTSAVLIDSSGQRSFGHHVGALAKLDADYLLQHETLLSRSRMLLIGYLSLLPQLEPSLPEVLQRARRLGCQTVLEAAGSGGDPEVVKACLPLVDCYFPSHQEAIRETGETQPERIVSAYRDYGCQGVVGVKLGADGAVVSEAAGHVSRIAPVTPPGKVVDTTGAGDCFLGAFLTGLLCGMDCEKAGRLAAAAGAGCVTCYGAQGGLLDLEETCRLAGVDPPMTGTKQPAAIHLHKPSTRATSSRLNS